MGSQDATITLKLDTRPAEADLRKFGKDASATAGRVNQGLNASGQGGGGGGGFSKSFGLGAGVAFGIGAGKRIAGSMFGGVGDVVTQYFSGLAADIDVSVGGAEARGKIAAREYASDAVRYRVGQTGDTSVAVNMYNQHVNRFKDFHMGKARANQEIAGGRGESSTGRGPLDEILDPIIAAIDKGFEGVWGMLWNYIASKTIGGGTVVK